MDTYASTMALLNTMDPTLFDAMCRYGCDYHVLTTRHSEAFTDIHHMHGLGLEYLWSTFSTIISGVKLA
jgi:hypothetical protein